MRWNIVLDICALVQLLVFFFYYFSIIRYPNQTNKIYSAISITVFVTIVFDVIVCIIDSYAALYPDFVVYGVNMLYLILIFILIRIFYAYVLALTDNNENWKQIGTMRDLPFLRITSYNVCYTKLLRLYKVMYGKIGIKKLEYILEPKWQATRKFYHRT